MIIEFPKKYDVQFISHYFVVSVPAEYAEELESLIKSQPWVNIVGDRFAKGNFDVYISKAYEITTEQAKQALERLCEYVMSPPVQIDDELSDELSAILSEEPL